MENRTSALTRKKLLQAEIKTRFCQVITKNEKVFCRKRSASLWFESVTKAGEEGDSHVFCHGKTAKLYSRIVGFQDEKQVSTSRKRKIETKQQILPE